MPTYEYKCDECGQAYNLLTTIADDASRDFYLGEKHWMLDELDDAPTCEGRLVRVFSVGGVIRSMPTHWNTAVGKPISSMSEFKSELSRQSDATAQRLNMPVNFQPHDPRDREFLGVTDEGIQVYDRSYVRRHAPDSEPKERPVRWLPPLAPQPPTPPVDR